MMNPMLNTRKPPGLRGEAMVARMRGVQAPRRATLPPSALHVGQTGAVNLKRWGGGRASFQPFAGANVQGSLPSYPLPG